jgi:D-beta-D-heptose 7-phosphate kinase/D-beta-D-heptose 1-phosphate adenosyltransferase
MKIVIVSGYFNPVHKGHIEYFTEAKKIAGEKGKVFVIINSDKQSILKKEYSFMEESDRLAVISSLKCVDHSIISIDTDRTVCKTIKHIIDNVITFEPNEYYFANGGDVTEGSPCPEEKVCKENNIKLIYGLGEKIQSSSWILQKSIDNINNIINKKRKLCNNEE